MSKWLEPRAILVIRSFVFSILKYCGCYLWWNKGWGGSKNSIQYLVGGCDRWGMTVRQTGLSDKDFSFETLLDWSYCLWIAHCFSCKIALLFVPSPLNSQINGHLESLIFIQDNCVNNMSSEIDYFNIFRTVACLLHSSDKRTQTKHTACVRAVL